MDNPIEPMRISRREGASQGALIALSVVHMFNSEERACSNR